MSLASSQNKAKEIAFFDGHAAVDDYDVFTPESNTRLLQACLRRLGLASGARVADLGCGSGVFSNLLQQAGYDCVGLDISPKLVALARRKYPAVSFVEGDVERLPFPSASFDGVLLSGIVHHLPDPAQCAAEVFRVLRRGGRFVAFDPNRRNPFMWLYRDRASPFYSPVGVTENERPILARETVAIFRRAGFATGADYLPNLQYRYVASAKVRWLLPVYNAVESTVFSLPFMRPFSSFVLTFGEKH
ncbi:MAG TPA: class I SAM-dependent methyltransferase [Xanthobacteraceae bacterium]|nr:class I SAM-dependent methyltransferase [Xanthobacteraceae bacterium]